MKTDKRDYRKRALLAVVAIAGFCVGSAVAEAQAVNLVVNGGFEDPAITGSFQVFSSIPGWTALPGSPAFEIQSGCCGTPFEGNQLCELDAFAPSAIFQDVPTQPGRVYELSFAFSARPGTPLVDNVLRVSWGGEEIATLVEDGAGLSDTSWTVHRFQVLGGPDATTRLVFEDLGAPNTLGTYIDDVRVVDIGFSITTSLPRHVQVGVPFSIQLQAGGGEGPLVWFLVAGTLPTGPNLSADGVLSGIPTDLGQFTFTARGIDARGQLAEQTYTIDVVVVLPPPDIRIRKSGTTPVPGRLLEYFITVENVGVTAAQELVVTEYLEPWFTFVSATPEPSSLRAVSDFFPLSTGHNTYIEFLHWDLPELKPGRIHILYYSVLLDPTISIGSTVHGQACTFKEKLEICANQVDSCGTDVILGGHPKPANGGHLKTGQRR